MTRCKFKDCSRAVDARKMCHTHYEQWRMGLKLRPISPRKKETGPRKGWKPRFCTVCGAPHFARDLCLNHYSTWRARQRGVKETIAHKPNRVVRETRSCVWFELPRGRVGVISRSDRGVLVERWGVTNGYVARRAPSNVIVYLHRVLMKPRGKREVDHKNGNKLDNRRSNLRVVTNGQQAQNQKVRADNSTGYRGIRRRKNGYEVRASRGAIVLQQSGLSTLKAAHAVAKQFRQQLFTHHNENRSIRDVEAADASE